jgi:hypothetical protein
MIYLAIFLYILVFILDRPNPFKEHQERRRSKSAWEISCELERIKQAIEMHNECFDNDLEIILKENEDVR